MFPTWEALLVQTETVILHQQNQIQTEQGNCGTVSQSFVRLTGGILCSTFSVTDVLHLESQSVFKKSQI